MFRAIVKFLGGPVFDIIDKVIEDKDEAAKLKSQLQHAVLDMSEKELSAATSILLAEINSDSAAAKNWRPHLMYFIMFMIGWIGLMTPLIDEVFALSIQEVTLKGLAGVPERMWGLLQIGIGAYVVGRSGEKIAEDYFRAKDH